MFSTIRPRTFYAGRYNVSRFYVLHQDFLRYVRDRSIIFFHSKPKTYNLKHCVSKYLCIYVGRKLQKLEVTCGKLTTNCFDAISNLIKNKIWKNLGNETSSLHRMLCKLEETRDSQSKLCFLIDAGNSNRYLIIGKQPDTTINRRHYGVQSRDIRFVYEVACHKHGR